MELKSEEMYDLFFQRKIFKVFLTNKDFTISLGYLLKTTYFDEPDVGKVFSILKKICMKYETTLTVSEAMSHITDHYRESNLDAESSKEAINIVKEIYRIPISTEQLIIDNFLKFVKRQEFRNAIFNTIDLLESNSETEFAKSIDLINSALSIGIQSKNSYRGKDLFNLPEIYNEKYDLKNMVRTGFPTFDQAIGGIGVGEVHCIQARPKTGKSTLASCIGAYNVLNGKNVFHVSLEISSEDVLAKYGVRLTGLTYEEATRVGVSDYRDKLMRHAEMVDNLYITHWPSGTATTLDIRAWITQEINQSKCPSVDLIIIDYDDELLPTNGEKDMYEKAGQIYTDMFGLASYFDCGILTFAQPKREAWDLFEEDELLRAHHLAHSAKKAHKASSVSSINFKRESDKGVLYADFVRRGTSDVKVPLVRDLTRGLLMEASGGSGYV